jgi:hypothetical protein
MYILEKGLSYQKLILVVEEKPDYLVFAGLNPLTELPRSPFFSLLSLSLSLKNNHEGDPKIPIGDFLIPL